MPTSRRRSSTGAPATPGSPSGARCCIVEGSEAGADGVSAPHAVQSAQRAAQHDRRREEARSLAAMIAAMIDGVWLRAALSEWQEADSESARALLTAFVDGRLQRPRAAGGTAGAGSGGPGRGGRRASRERRGRSPSINPATGEVLARVRGRRRRAGRRGRGARARGAARTGRRSPAPSAGACCSARRRCCARATTSLPSSRRAIPASRSRRPRVGRRALGRRVPRVFRRPRREPRRRAYRSRAAGLRLHAARAARRGRRHRRLELPAADRLLEDRRRRSPAATP